MLDMRARLVQSTRYLRPVERFKNQRGVKSTASTPLTNDGFERLAAEDAEPPLMCPSAGLFPRSRHCAHIRRRGMQRILSNSSSANISI